MFLIISLITETLLLLVRYQSLISLSLVSLSRDDSTLYTLHLIHGLALGWVKSSDWTTCWGKLQLPITSSLTMSHLKSCFPLGAVTTLMIVVSDHVIWTARGHRWFITHLFFFPPLIHATQRWKVWWMHLSNVIIICKVKCQYGPSSRLHTAFNPKAVGIDSSNFLWSVKDNTRVHACMTLYLNGSHVDAIYALCQHWSFYGSGCSCAKFLDASMAGWGYTCGVALCGPEEAGRQCAVQQHAAR